jgi:mannose-6-phosphate isomerase
MVDRLDCTVMPYAWGSRTAIAELTGRASPSPGAEAELWMGAHPMAPARLERGASTVSLAELIAKDPERELGAAIAAVFGPRLPFLLKVLAAERPLSLQAHPTEAQARAGFDAEEARAIPRDAPTRNYRDPNHKPELLCALTPFDALCGFRRAADTVRLFDELAVPELADVLAPLRAGAAGGVAAAFRAIMTLPKAEGARIVAATVEACRASTGGFGPERAWAIALDRLYPGDVGVVSALLLNLVHLEPGEAIYLGAGNLHAYLGGVGIELMASSDNVLRGGLTTKHVDVPELMRVLDFADGPIAPLHARVVDAAERVYDTPAREFRLSVIDLAAGTEPVLRQVGGPEILLCVAGAVVVTPATGPHAELTLERGASAFVSGGSGAYALRPRGAERASVYRATVNLR